MQRVPSAPLPPTSSTPHELQPPGVVPHATACTDLPIERGWSPTARDTRRRAAATFIPCGFESEYAYPLLVWLHGAGTDPDTLPEVMRHVSVRNFVAVAPHDDSPHAVDSPWNPAPEAAATAEDAVFDAIEAAQQRFRLHDRRVFLAGSGAGGSMAMRIALRNPEHFGGVATLDGPLPRRGRLLARVNQVRQLPLLLSASRESAAYNEASVCNDLRLLHSAGCRVAVRQYPGSDDLTTAMLADLNRWLMQLVCDGGQSR